jgi:hypothetical protein
MVVERMGLEAETVWLGYVGEMALSVTDDFFVNNKIKVITEVSVYRNLKIFVLIFNDYLHL